ncbi:DinI family protein [Vibrio sinensis]|uniref:DinI family protein n=1 Tax=Vibrio sinensis TaxID=2302434 RepID=A0A3A6QLP6_9VIBR|nr:DinI-like family protein [Vibrio sinensis]RJX68708.1 DinI family protein [Vibrio sinensis]
MRIEMMVDEKMLPKQGCSKITAEMEKRLLTLYPDIRIRVRKGSNNQLDIYAKIKDDKKKIHNIIEAMFNESDEWLTTEFA